MNELQRQHYLSALGIDTYMPRWQLPFAPISYVSTLIPSAVELVLSPYETKVEASHIQSSPSISQAKVEVNNSSQTNNLLNNLFETKKVSASKPQLVGAAAILAQLDVRPANIEAFSLSIWRPFDGVMIVDSRNSKLALPTELLLNNILRSFFSTQAANSKEEILRWPMIENSFTKRTADDARVELQTWLSVQHEIRPIQYLWLMGENAATHLLPEQADFTNSFFNFVNLTDSAINALILPSLNEILQKPTLKQKIFAAIRRYHFATL